MTATSQEKRLPLAYHFQGEGDPGTGICGTPGMIGTLDNPAYPVTCERCKRHPAYLAAVNVACRYAGASKRAASGPDSHHANPTNPHGYPCGSPQATGEADYGPDPMGDWHGRNE